MQTQGGQATSGALGQDSEAATLAASRTGNPAAINGVIDESSRNAMRQQSENTLGIDLQDAKLKQQQQQFGAAGLGSLYGEDTAAALRALGLEDDTINAWTGAKKAANADMWTSIKNIGQMVGGAASGIAGGGAGGGE